MESDDAAVTSERDVALVTGGTGGIGREIVRSLAAEGATVLVHGRDREKGRRVCEEVAAETGNEDLHLYTADFADTGAVRGLADSVHEDVDRLDVLVNNAGTWQGDRHLVSMPGCSEGVELTFAVNHLGHFLLTHRLADLLAAGGTTAGVDSGDGEDGSESEGEGEDDADDGTVAAPARVVVVASEVHRRVDLDLDAVCGPDGPSGVDAYGQSKLANVMFTYELARRLPDGVVANSCHPGTVPATDLDRGGSLLGSLGWNLMGLLGHLVDITETPTQAAETPLYLARSPEVADVTGEYFDDCERTRSSEAAYDRNAQRELWETSAEWVGLTEDEQLPE